MRFAEWYPLNETVNVEIDGYDRPEKRGNIWDIANALKRRIARMPGASQGTNVEGLTIDGLDVDAQQGRLNYYVKGIGIEHLEGIQKALKMHLDEMGVKYGPFHMDKSEMFKGEPVIRIPILQISKQEETGPPELNMANENALLIFRNVLGYPDFQVGHTFDARDLLNRIRSLGPIDIEGSARPAMAGQGGNVQSYRGEYSTDMIKDRLNRLEQIAQWAIDNDYDELVVT